MRTDYLPSGVLARGFIRRKLDWVLILMLARNLVSFSTGDRTKTFSISTTEDSTSESTEIFSVAIAFLVGATIDSSTPAAFSNLSVPHWIATILDDDNPSNPNITIASGTLPVTKGTDATFTVTVTPAPTSATSVSVAISEETSGGQDFVASTNEITHTVTIPASGSPNVGTATLTIPTVGDTTDEPNGAVTAALSGGSGYTVGTPSSATVTVNDDYDATDMTAPHITSITRRTPSSSPTDADNLTWRVTFNEMVRNVDATDFSIGGTTAGLNLARFDSTNAYDVNASGGNLAGLTGTVTLSFADDQNISDSSGNDLSDTTPTGTNHNTFVVNNAPTLSLSLSSTSGAEGNSGSRDDVNVNFSMSNFRTRIDFLFCLKNTGTDTFRTAQGKRAKDFDLLLFSSGDTPPSLGGTNCHSFQAGSPNYTLARLKIFGDTTAEGNETAVLELRRRFNTPADVVISPTAGTATYTITNDDGTPPVITISGGSAATEGTGASFTVNANPAPTANLDVSVGVTQKRPHHPHPGSGAGILPHQQELRPPLVGGTLP